MKFFINILATFSFMLWWGGFTFYAAFVIPTGQKVLGNHVMMGFITEQVAPKINIAALAACLLCFINEWLLSGKNFRSIPSFVWICLSLMLALIIASFTLYPFMQALLNYQTHTEIDHAQFYFLHRIYLLLATTLWVNGIIYIGLTLKGLLHSK